MANHTVRNCSRNDPDDFAVISISDIAIICIIFIIILIIILGNVLVITAVVKDQRLRRQVQNWLIVSLAAADLLVGFPIMPLTLTYQVKGRWLFGRLLCEIWLASDVLFVTASILNLCAISLDRYFSISRPTSYPATRNLRRMSLIIMAVWFLALAISLPPLVGWRHDPESRRPGACEVSNQMSYVLYSSCGSFFIPVVIIIMVYCKIYVITRRRARRRKNAEHKFSKNVVVFAAEQNAGDTIAVVDDSDANDDYDDLSNIRNFKRCGLDEAGRSRTSDKRAMSVKTGFNRSKADQRLWNMSLKLVGEPRQAFLKMEKSLSLRFSTSSDRIDEKHSDGGSILDHDPASVTETEITMVRKSIPSNALSCYIIPENDAADEKRGIVTVHDAKKFTLASKCSTISSIYDDSRQRLSSFLKFHRRPNLKNDSFASGAENVDCCISGDAIKTTAAPTDAANTTTNNVNSELRMRQKLRRRRDRQATIVLGSILLAFILCWLPFFVIYVLNAICCSTPSPVFDFFFWLGYCNSALNPFIYNYFNVEYRRAFRKILSCKTTVT
uniref:G-protein coupled receptors family 1 profile domain-containing protein n=1 Tax=Romanomermis culicivorax TaxID=13658 RepID=A0A915JH27_ROMCU